MLLRRILIVLMLALLVPAVQSQEDPLSKEQRAWLDQHGPIRVGISEDSVPNTGVDASGRPIGFGVEIVALASLKVAADVEFVVVPRQQAVDVLAAGEIDVLGSFPARPDLEAIADASSPIAVVPFMMVTTQASEYVRLEDLQGPIGTVGEAFGARLLHEHVPHLEVVTVESHAEGLLGLENGIFDGYFGPLAALGHTAQEEDIDIKPLGAPFASATLSMWAPKDEPLALQILEIGMQRISREEAALIHVKWTGFSLTPPLAPAVVETFPAWVMTTLMVLVAVALVAFVVVGFSRRQVHRATTELAALNKELEQRVLDRTRELEQQSAALEQGNKQLERFAYVASHDLQAPLRHISSFIQFMVDKLEQGDAAAARAYADKTVASVARMRELVQALLTLSRAHVDITHDQVVVLGELMVEVRQSLAETIRETGARVDLGPLPDVRGDPVLLKQVFQNLIENALQYPGDGPPQVEVRTDPEAGSRIQVLDRGPGIPEPEIEGVFTMFHRLDQSRPGTGMGLPICRAILERHGGTVTAVPRPGGGMIFTVELPVDRIVS